MSPPPRPVATTPEGHSEDTRVRPPHKDGGDMQVAATVGAELSAHVRVMQEIVQALRDTHRLTRGQMLALSQSLDAAAAIARQSQQLARLAGGRLRQSHERIALDQVIQQALDERQLAWLHSGIRVRSQLRPVEVIVDPGLLSSLVDAALAWAAAHGTQVAMNLLVRHWPEHALLVIRAGHGAPQADGGTSPALAESLNWHLLSQIGLAMGETVTREIQGQDAVLMIEFSRTVKKLQGLTAMEIDTDRDSAFHTGTRPLAGLRVLLVCSEPGLRAEIGEVCRALGLVPDAVLSSEAATRRVELDPPHLIIVDQRLRDPAFDVLCQDIRHLDPNAGFLEITDDVDAFEIGSWMSDSMTRVSRKALRTHLPSVLTLELARAL